MSDSIISNLMKTLSKKYQLNLNLLIDSLIYNRNKLKNSQSKKNPTKNIFCRIVSLSFNDLIESHNFFYLLYVLKNILKHRC